MAGIAIVTIVALGLLATLAAFDHAWLVMISLGAACAALTIAADGDCDAAKHHWKVAVQDVQSRSQAARSSSALEVAKNEAALEDNEASRNTPIGGC